MYNTHETITVEPGRGYDEKRQADDRKTKQKMELIRSKLKTHTRKDHLRPPSSSKQIRSNLINHHHNHNHHRNSNSFEYHQHRPLTYSISANLFNTYNLLSTTTKNDLLLHEEDSED